MTTTEDATRIAAGLSEADCNALATLPLPGWKPDRVFMFRGNNVSYSSTWRKSTKHRRVLEGLETLGIVERTVSRGETLWRLTKPLGLAVRNYLIERARP